MKAIKDEFPNPVLATGRDDYIESCRFYTTFDENEIIVDSDNISITMEYVLECNGLRKRISDGDAVVVVTVKSSAASYSKLFRFKSDETKIVIKIPKFSVVNKMDITGAIVAARNIDQFSCEGEFNELYFGTSTFEIRKGDILATENSRSVYVDDSELEKPISSIFDISRNDEQETDIVPIFYDQKIEISLKKELFDLYYKFKDFNNGVLRRYAAGIIVYPVLVEAITIIIGYYQNVQNGDDEDLSEKRWFRAIEHKSANLGINIQDYDESSTTLADKLLGGVALDALKSFKDTLDSEVNSGETEMIGGID